jgi:polyisoprenoid-binding protein YceI
MKMVRVALLAALLAAPAFAAETYIIDPRHTLPSYEIDHFGWSTQRGRFERVSGKITLDRAAKTGTVEVVIDVASVSTGVAKLDEHLRNPDFFDVARYPTMTFRSERIVFDGERPAAVPGVFTLLGVTRPVTLTITFFHCAPNTFAKKEACGANAVATIRRTEFGMTRYAPGLGDEVKLLINVEAFKD